MIPTAETVSSSAPRVWEVSGADLTVQQPRSALGSGLFKLLLQVKGGAEVIQSGRRTVLTTDEFAFVDGAQPFQVIMDGAFEQILVTLPRSSVTALHRGIERRTAVRHGGHGSERLIRDFLVAFAASGMRMSETGHAYATSALVQLVGGLSESPTDGARDSLYRRAIVLIDLNIADANSDTIAAQLGISRRYLDLLFSREGRTFSKMLWDRRLAVAADRLRRFDELSVTEIAHSVGFKDSAHFSHAFRSRYGEPPSAWRAKTKDGHQASGTTFPYG